jgi:hypothetical protein
MQKNISTNIHIPEHLYKATKIEAVRQGKTMRQLILDGLRLVLGGKEEGRARSKYQQNLFSEFSGKAKAKPKDASVKHDRYLYD